MARKKKEKAPIAYHAHRERQRRRILDAAGKLFEERGIDRATMAEITAASGIQPSTMYQYFANKDEIVWSLLGELMEESGERAKRCVNKGANGFSRLAALMDWMAAELREHPAKVRFMAQFDATYARDWPAERLITLESEINPEGFQVFSDLIRAGMADGSLRSDLDPDLTMHAVINAVVGAQRRLASLGEKVELEYGHPVDRLFSEAVRVFLLGLRAPESAASRHGKKQKPAKRTTKKRSS